MHEDDAKSRRPWGVIIIVSCGSIFLGLGLQAQVPPLAMNILWMPVSLCVVGVCCV